MKALLLALTASVAFAACSSGTPDAAGALPPGTTIDLGTQGKIDHVVVMIQENRSFDDLFATFPHADGTRTGLMSRPKASPTAIPLAKVRLADPTMDFEHTFWGFALEYDRGRMDGFNTINYEDPNCNCAMPAGTKAYQYVDPQDVAPYWTLAKNYGLADHLFQTQRSGSFTAHLDLIRGSTSLTTRTAVVDWPGLEPWGCDSPANTVTNVLVPSPTGNISTQQLKLNAGPFPCYRWTTIANLLDTKHVSWKYYTPQLCSPGCTPASPQTLWNAFDAIRYVRYGPDWKSDISSPEKNIFADISNGKLPAVSWVVPDNANSDHPVEPSDTGPSWVAQVVNAIGKSKYWKHTAVVVLWDDWGGFYDHELPPSLDYQGLGFRVPMIVISPYTPQGEISHTQYEFGSVLKFIENNWSLGSLNTTDVRANSIVDMFDFTQAPRPFHAVQAKYSRAFFDRQRPSHRPVDDE